MVEEPRDAKEEEGRGEGIGKVGAAEDERGCCMSGRAKCQPLERAKSCSAKSFWSK